MVLGRVLKHDGDCGRKKRVDLVKFKTGVVLGNNSKTKKSSTRQGLDY